MKFFNNFVRPVCFGRTMYHPFQSIMENEGKRASFASLQREMKSVTCYFSFVYPIHFPHSSIHWYPILCHPRLENIERCKGLRRIPDRHSCNNNILKSAGGRGKGYITKPAYTITAKLVHRNLS